MILGGFKMVDPQNHRFKYKHGLLFHDLGILHFRKPPHGLFHEWKVPQIQATLMAHLIILFSEP